ncbi:helix-turn-helix domain-containing protein [Agromyces sp. NPDC057679]|uniref:helix-turn-helix domain-containing protein n=1 Tax=Agromyces sp. NPDC057679 TaxID=3346207 RepID=UPI00366E32E4
MTDEKALNVAEVASILGLHPQTVYLHARSGEIPGFRVGRAWRFYRSEVEAHLRKPSTEIQSAQSRGRKRKP